MPPTRAKPDADIENAPCPDVGTGDAHGHHYWHYGSMPGIAKLVAAMRNNPNNIRCEDALKVCEHYFGAPRSNGTSHHVYRTPWPGEPYVNIQRGHDGKAKAYQIRQILKAIDRVEDMR